MAVISDDGFIDPAVVKLLNNKFNGEDTYILSSYCVPADDRYEDNKPVIDGMLLFVVRSSSDIPRTEEEWRKMERTCERIYFSKNGEWAKIK